MRRIFVSPSKVFGNCPSGYTQTDYAVIDNNNIRSKKGPMCYVFIGMLNSQVLSIQNKTTFMNHVSCPGCSSGDGRINKVVFVLGWAKVWQTVKILSEYNWYKQNINESEEMKNLRYQCWDYALHGNKKQSKKLAKALLKKMKGILNNEI